MSETTAPTREGFREHSAISDADAFIFGPDEFDVLFPMIISLPDGQTVLIDALLAAAMAGESTVPTAEGATVSIDLLVGLLTKSFGKTWSEGETGESGHYGQASFPSGADLAMLKSFLENGRIGLLDESAAPPGTLRRVKEKPAGREELVDVLVDGPDPGDDIIRPPSNDPGADEFSERVRDEKTSPIFDAARVSGNLYVNDAPGANGYASIVSVAYKGVAYTPQGNQLVVIEEPGVWRLTINLAGTPGDPTTGYGNYTFEQIAAYDHSQTPDGETADFALTYTVEDSDGRRDVAEIGFVIRDSNPTAGDDDVATVQNRIAYGDVSENDSIGADRPGGYVEIGTGDLSVSAGDADEDGRVTLAGAYGALVFDFDDGHYEYRSESDVLDGGVDRVVDEFYYVIADSDGDIDAAFLRFEIVLGDVPPDDGPVSNDGAENVTGRTEGLTYVWSDLSDIDNDLDDNVDGIDVIENFIPKIDRLDIDGLLASLGYDDVATAGEVFRLTGSEAGIELQVDLGAGWQTFATLGNMPSLTVQEVEAALVV